MDWNNKKSCFAKTLSYFLLGLLMVTCTVSYKFNGASIDYTKIKSISVADFPNQAPLVYAPLAQVLTEKIKDTYTTQTRLNLLRQGGDLNLEGEVVGYDLSPQAVKEDAYASETRLTITVRVRFANSTNPDEDFERNYSAFRNFSNDKMINEVQDQLIKEIVEEICDRIYNDTVAKW